MSLFTFPNMIQFMIIYIAYGSCYLLRMPFGVLKDDLLLYYNVPLQSLGYIDLGFLLPYAVVSLTMSSFVEYFGARLTLSCSLLISSLASFVLPFCSSYALFIFFIVILGIFQALCWPSACSVISHINDNKSSSVFGLFGSCCFVGGIAGKFLSVWLKSNTSLVYVFIVPALYVIFLSIIVLVFVKNIPSSKLSMKPLNDESNLNSKEQSTKNTVSFSVWKTWKLPGISEVSVTMFFVKCIRYMFIFWLPLYLIKVFQYSSSKAGYVSLAFDVGGIIGSVFVGHTSDICLKGKDMLICLFTIVGSTVSLLLFWAFPTVNCSILIVFLIWIGGMYGGSDILLCGSVAAKLGKRYKTESSVTHVTGLVNGVGSLGTVIEGPLIAYFTSEFGWDSVLLLIFVFSAIASYFAMKANSLLSSPNFRI